MIKYYKVDKICKLWRENPLKETNLIDKSNIKFDDTIYCQIQHLIKKYEMMNAVLEHDEKMNPQLTFIKFTGTNGKEGSIKSSLLEIYYLLNDLDSEKGVTWSQVLDVSIDCLDDTYAFVITLTLEK